MSWQDGEPQQPGGCAYVDVDGAWRTTGCNTKLQGAVCGRNSGECPAAGADGRTRHSGTLLQPCTLHHRAPSSPKNKLPRQLSPRAGRLRLDSLQGALLLLPHGAAAGPQGGAAALPERWAGASWVVCGLCHPPTPPGRPVCPDMGLSCVQWVGQSYPFWMRWRTCSSGSICRAPRARVGVPGWA